MKSKGQSHGFTPRLEVDDRLVLAPKTMEEIDENSSNREIENTSKNHKKLKILQLKIGEDLAQTHGYIDANQEFTRCRNHPNILLLFGRSERSLTSLLPSLGHEAHTTPSDKDMPFMDTTISSWSDTKRSFKYGKLILIFSTNYFENLLLPNNLIIVMNHGDDVEDKWGIKRALERQGGPQTKVEIQSNSEF
jgi:hypothetical protein